MKHRCPWCGGPVPYAAQDGEWHRAYCIECGPIGPAKRTKQEAEEAYDKMPVFDAVVEALEGIAKYLPLLWCQIDTAELDILDAKAKAAIVKAKGEGE